MDHKPKISDAAAFLLMSLAIIADLLNWIPIANWIVTLITLAIFQIYFRIKGVAGIYGLLGNLGETIPLVSILPCISFAVGYTIWVDRHPKSTLAKVSKVAEVAKGKFPGKTQAGIKTPIGKLGARG